MAAWRPSLEPVAIIGMGCRFPGGADDPDSYYRALLNGVDAVTEIPRERWNVEAFYHAQPGTPGKAYARWGGFIEKVDEFEPACFRISPREAAFMDPQQRLLLEVAWNAFEDAGISTSRVAGSATGVFIGVSTWDYSQIQTTEIHRRALTPFSAIGTSLAITANRVSYCFDLRGPSMAIDTACSSSLVAVDRAINSLRSGECRMAIAGGVNLLLAPEAFIAYCAASLLSRDGRCKAFDASANGFVRGEGAGVVLLKPLKDAERDGDPILAVILASGLNQDGRTEGIASPNADAQRTLLEEVYGKSGVDPAEVAYFEAHGTGTAVGDPIEANTVGGFFSGHLPSERRLLLGSVKTNIGHLEAASGIAALIKLVQCVKNRVVPPNLHFHDPNPKIDFGALKLQVPTVPTSWPEDAPLAIGSMNSFGFGGTNAHLVVSEYRPRATSARAADAGPELTESTGPLLLPITARSEAALRLLAQAFAQLLSSEEAPKLSDLCYTAALRRTLHDHRLALTVSAARSTAEKLETFAREGSAYRLSYAQSQPARPKIALVFSGQGTQWPRMGLKLMKERPIFASVMKRCDALFRDLGAPWSLLEEIARDPLSSKLQETPIAQPAIFAVQAGLIELWRSWGIEADAVLGHSIGEVAAAFAAGVYGLEDAARLAYHRGRTMGLAIDGGRMLAADLSEADALDQLGRFEGRLSLAAVNAPRSVTFSGRPDDVRRLEEQLKEAGTWCKLLNVNHAFHSRDMDAARIPLLEAIAGLGSREADRTFVSSVTGGTLDFTALTADYWWKNVRQPVRFHQCLQTLLALSYGVFLEVGPHPALLQSIIQSAAGEGLKVDALPSLRRGQDDSAPLLDSLGTLFTLGCPVDFRFLKSANARFVKLPSHPWMRTRFWNEAPGQNRHGPDPHPLLGSRLPTGEPGWRQTVDIKQTPYLAHHRVDGRIVVAGAVFVEMALAAAKNTLATESCELEQIRFRRALLLSEESAPVVETRVYSAEGRIEIASAAGDDDPDWTSLFSARFGERVRSGNREPQDVRALELAMSEPIPPQELYERFERNGLEFGPSFRGIRRVRRGASGALAEIALDEALIDEGRGYGIHPALLDACFQTLSAALPPGEWRGLYLPESIARIDVRARPTTPLRAHARLTTANELIVEGDLSLYTPDGVLATRIEGFRCRRAPRSGRVDESALESCLYELDWKRRNLSATKPAEHGDRDFGKRTWVILADDQGLGASLANQLERRDARCIQIYAGSGFERRSRAEYVVDPSAIADLRKLLRASTEGRLQDVQGVVHLWALDETEANAGAARVERAEVKLCHSLMHLIQALDDGSFDAPAWLFLVTRGARDLGRGDLSPACQQTFLTGLGRVLANEFRRYRLRQVDLDPAAAAWDSSALLTEILAASSDEEVALRDDQRWIPRFERAEPEPFRVDGAAKTPGTPIRLEAGRKGGALDSLTWRETVREPVGADEVEIGVTHVGLNFRDVLKVLGRYPAETPADTRLGDECVGTIVRVGPHVRGFQIGDRVVAVGAGCLRSHAVVAADFVLPLPAHYSPAEAATLPVAFLTALHSLHTLARITDRDSILIHSAAGGVGMAAFQIAKRAGARIFATAGSEEKRSLLRQMGADHVMNSRTLAFADEVGRLTNGRGVDLVLNSLAGRAMTKSIECLAPGGRFLELGKRDTYGGTRIDLWPFRKSVSYFTIDLARVLFGHSPLETETMREFAESLAKGRIQSLPFSTYHPGSISKAFRSMSQGRHIGKIVIDMTSSEVVAERTPASSIDFEPNATYLVSGGLGGFGLQVSRWIVENGGRHLALLGRRGPSGETAKFLDELRDRGAEVMVARCDVADEGQLANALKKIRETLPPLRGVFHLAAVLEDGILLNLSPERFSRAFRPKAVGAWNLHRSTLDDGLDHFVLFSSISAAIGNPGQASYAAANSFLEGLAAFRRSRGLPAKAIAWGLLRDAGMTAGRDGLVRISEQRGLLTMTARECFDTLPAVIRRCAATTLVARFAWDRFSRSFGIARSSEGVLASMLTAAGGAGETSGSDRLQSLLHCSPAERRERVSEYLTTHVARILGASPEKIELERPLHEQGFDSLMLVELALIVQDDFGSQIPSASVSPSTSIRTLAATLADKLRSASPGRSGLPSMEQECERHEPICRPILMRLSGDRDPLFLIHPLGVHEGVYRALVDALTADRPIYGISSNLEAGRSTGPVSIDARVEAFVDNIREIQSHGPYFLCGYSMGGHLAMKTAAVLEEMGESVAFVGLIEWELGLAAVAADITSTQVQTANLFVAVYRLLETRFGILAHLPQERLVREATEAARRMTTGDHDATASAAYEWMVAKGYLIKNVSRDLLEGYFGQLFVNFSLLASDSAVRRIEAPVYVWRARDGLSAGDFVWGELVPNLQSEEVVEGDHFSIMIPPSSTALARSIGACLGE